MKLTHSKSNRKINNGAGLWKNIDYPNSGHFKFYEKRLSTSLGADTNNTGRYFSDTHFAPIEEIIIDQAKYQFSEQSYDLRPVSSKKSTVWYGTRFLGVLDQSFSDLLKEIEESKYILNQKLSSEDQFSPVYSEEIWIKAIKFIIKYANQVFKHERQQILTPKIYHGPEGSIDFYWDFKNVNVLMNIPLVGKGSYSGEDNFEDTFSGYFNPEDPNYKYLPFIF